MPDLAAIRRANALLLFDEFVRNTVSNPDAATLRGLDRRFAERVQIQPSYWSQIKSRARQIGERLARQFESRCGKQYGWMDLVHETATPRAESLRPANDDERFVVDLVLAFYRRDPVRAKARLLASLGEVLGDPDDDDTTPARDAAPAAPRKSAASVSPAPRPTARARK